LPVGFIPQQAQGLPRWIIASVEQLLSGEMLTSTVIGVLLPAGILFLSSSTLCTPGIRVSGVPDKVVSKSLFDEKPCQSLFFILAE